jgi:hypothetical protein
MVEKRCVYKCGAWNCGSYQFNLYKDDIDQGDLCDVHYWQAKAQRPWQGLTDEDRRKFAAAQYGWEDLLIAAEAKLKERNT